MTSREEFDAMTPDAGLRRLKEGNARFVAGKPMAKDLPREVAATAGGQTPFALVHGCIDSRASAELIFDQGVGDIFHTRVAGNVIDGDVIAGMEYACEVIGTPLIVVMGHTGCGAVRGACDGLEMGNLTELLEKIRPAIDTVQATLEPSEPGFPDRVAQEHVKRMVSEISDRSGILKARMDRGKLRVQGALYHVEDGRVTFF